MIEAFLWSNATSILIGFIWGYLYQKRRIKPIIEERKVYIETPSKIEIEKPTAGAVERPDAGKLDRIRNPKKYEAENEVEKAFDEVFAK